MLEIVFLQLKQHRLPITIKQQNGQLASSTGNITGIYDLSGGAWEQVASYITNGNGNLGNGTVASGIPSLVVKTTADATAYQLLSSKYATIYPYNKSSDTNDNNYTAYKNANYGYGDASLETSSNGSNSMSWFGDYSGFVHALGPFFLRGGSYNNGISTGAFAFGSAYGNFNSAYSFRVVLVS